MLTTLSIQCQKYFGTKYLAPKIYSLLTDLTFPIQNHCTQEIFWVWPKTSFQLRMGLKKGKKQGRDERMREDYPTSAKVHIRCRVGFLRSFHLCLVSVCFSGPTLTEIKVYRNFLHTVFVLFWGFSKPPSKQKMSMLKQGHQLQYGHCVQSWNISYLVCTKTPLK